jgi:multidrug transporter EmrE-like cation transporter
MDDFPPAPGTPGEGWGEGLLGMMRDMVVEESPHPTLSRSTGRGEEQPQFALSRHRSLAWFLNPYVQIAIGSVLVAVSELALKRGAADAAARQLLGGWFGISALGSWWTWLGIVTYLLSFASWLHVLRLMPLGIAYGLISICHVLVPMGSWLFLGEVISGRRWAGVGLIIVGIALVAKPAAGAEEKL